MQGGMQILLKAICVFLSFIEVKDMAVRVVGRNLGSHCPVSCLSLSGLPRLMQNVLKILVATSNSCKLSAAFRSDRQGREGQGAEVGGVHGGCHSSKGEGRRAGCSLLQSPSDSCSEAERAALPAGFKTAASCCWQLLPGGTREKMHQQTAFLEGFIVPSHYKSTNPRSLWVMGRYLGNIPWKPQVWPSTHSGAIAKRLVIFFLPSSCRACTKEEEPHFSLKGGKSYKVSELYNTRENLKIWPRWFTRYCIKDPKTCRQVRETETSKFHEPCGADFWFSKVWS